MGFFLFVCLMSAWILPIQNVTLQWKHLTAFFFFREQHRGKKQTKRSGLLQQYWEKVTTALWRNFNYHLLTQLSAIKDYMCIDVVAVWEIKGYQFICATLNLWHKPNFFVFYSSFNRHYVTFEHVFEMFTLLEWKDIFSLENFFKK